MSDGRRRALGVGAFIVVVLAAEIVGRWSTERLALAIHLPGRPHGGLDLYPLLVVATKLAIGLLLARLCWRLVQARRLLRAGQRGLRQLGLYPRHRLPRVRLTLSPRLWLALFTATSLLYLVPTSTAEAARGFGPVLEPWGHSVALPVFALLSVVLALVWGVVSTWLHALERYAEATVSLARRGRLTSSAVAHSPRTDALLTPRSLFGLVFESRPPPLTAS